MSTPQSDPVTAELRRLREDNQHLKLSLTAMRSRLREALAQLDSIAGYQVIIVPGERYLAEALLKLKDDPTISNGDHIRCADTMLEMVRQDGIWVPLPVLTVLEFLVNGTKGEDHEHKGKHPLHE
jgi:hypothetical protein